MTVPSLRHQPELAQRVLDDLGASIASVRERVGLPPSDPFDISAIRTIRRSIAVYAERTGVPVNRLMGHQGSLSRRDGENDWDLAVRAYRAMQRGEL